MIDRLQGQVLAKSDSEIVVGVGGVGYKVLVSAATVSSMPEPGSGDVVTIHTHLHVREDALTLYGFATESERALYIMLTTVTGVGPKLAMTALSGMSESRLKSAIAGADIKALTAVSGIGKKVAERLVLELKGKTGTAAAANAGSGANAEDAVLALMALGYKKTEARTRVSGVESAASKTVSEIVAEACR